jgi:hypothetical protein
MADVSRANAAAPTDRILEAAAYLEQCRIAGQRFAIVTGPDAAAVRGSVGTFLDALPAGCRVARLPAPTDSEHVFLEAILAQLGFEPFDSTADDLQRLLLVVLRQASAQQASTVLVIEDAQDFGPRVLEAVREIARNAADLVPAPLIVLSGHAGLNRVLASRGMASVAAWTAHRFDFAAPPRPAPVPAQAAPHVPAAVAAAPVVHLVLSLNSDVVRQLPFDKPRMLIGRSQYCDVHIPSRFVSRQHALLLRNADGDWLVDLKSTNGTSVNSKVVEHRRLADGDIISIGNYRLRYHNPASAGAPGESTRDPLGETIVMRSLQALRTGAPAAVDAGEPADDTSSTAA